MPAGSLEERFLGSLRTLLPPPQRGPWIAALSGGCDSTALLRLLREAAELDPAAVPPLERITAVHVHHGLRGREADADEAFSESLARRFGFPFRSRRLSPPAGLAPGAVENWARTERYRVLGETALEVGASVILTGHNRNDQAETVLQRLLRGAGFWGLAGIRPSRPVDRGCPVLLVRPLLDVTRHDLAAWLDRIDQPHTRDRTNEEAAFQRNRIRLLLLPRLEQADPGMVDELCRMAETARSLHESLDRAARSTYRRLVREEDTGSAESRRLEIPLPRFHALPEHLRFALIRLISNRLAPRQVPLTRKAYGAAMKRLKEPEGSIGPEPVSSWSLAPGLFLKVTPDALLIESSPLQTERAWGGEKSFEAALALPGTTPLPDGSSLIATQIESRKQAEAVIAGKAGRKGEQLTEVVDADEVGSPLQVRFRRAGDLFHPLGAPGGKKLKSFLIEQKIPASQRDTIPLLVKDGTIVWVAGMRIGHAFRITGKTSRFVLLTWSRES